MFVFFATNIHDWTIEAQHKLIGFVDTDLQVKVAPYEQTISVTTYIE